MTAGQIVAARYKRQYCINDRWESESSRKIHRILMELTTKEAIEALLDASWTRGLKQTRRVRRDG